jgi:hypothetical protein
MQALNFSVLLKISEFLTCILLKEQKIWLEFKAFFFQILVYVYVNIIIFTSAHFCEKSMNDE